MIVRIYQNTGGDHLGFSDVTRRYAIDFAQGPQLRALATGANQNSALIDRESPFNLQTAQRATGVKREGEGARVSVNGQPSDLVLTKVELATLAYAMPTGHD